MCNPKPYRAAQTSRPEFAVRLARTRREFLAIQSLTAWLASLNAVADAFTDLATPSNNMMNVLERTTNTARSAVILPSASNVYHVDDRVRRCGPVSASAPPKVLRG